MTPSETTQIPQPKGQSPSHSLVLKKYTCTAAEFCPSGNVDLTGLLGERGGFALAALRHGDHADVVVDAGLQSVDRVMAGGRMHHVLKDGHALAGGHHRDPVAGDGRGAVRRPAQTDGGVAHVLEAEVRQLWDFWRWGRREEEGKREESRDIQTRGESGRKVAVTRRKEKKGRQTKCRSRG